MKTDLKERREMLFAERRESESETDNDSFFHQFSVHSIADFVADSLLSQ